MIIFYFISTSLFIYGVKASFSEGMLLEPIKIKLITISGGDLNNAKRFLLIGKACKVLFDCTPCMASLYGTFSYCLFIVDNWGDIIYLPIFVFCLCGFNYLINKILN